MEDEVCGFLRFARRAPGDDASVAKVVLRAKVIVGVIATWKKNYVPEDRKEVGKDFQSLCIRINMESPPGLAS